jgi:hypothetical protein
MFHQVLSMDANTGRALVRMAVGSNELEMSELFLKPVSAKEYRDSARILSKLNLFQAKFLLKLIISFICQTRKNTTSTKRNRTRSETRRKEMIARAERNGSIVVVLAIVSSDRLSCLAPPTQGYAFLHLSLVLPARTVKISRC